MANLIRRKLISETLCKLGKQRRFSVFTAAESTTQTRWPRNGALAATRPVYFHEHTRRRFLHASRPLQKIVAFKLSDIGEGIREVVVKEWFVKVGDKVEQFDNICEVQSDKAAVTITSRYDGVITKLYGAADETLLVGNPLVDIDVQGDGDKEDSQSTTPGTDSNALSSDDEAGKAPSEPRSRVLTTPAVRRIASQYNVDLRNVNATGRNGRVLKEDVLLHLNLTSDQSNEVAAPVAVQARPWAAPAQLATATAGGDRVVPVSGFTKAMVKTMTESLKIPHFVLSDEYDVSELVRVRSELRAAATARGVRLTYMPFMLKAASLALQQYPMLNSTVDAGCENVTYRAAHNIGVAMDTPNGLVVPVIKNVEQRTILEIASELNRLQELGAQGRLGLAEVSGGTFTISNIGNVGGTYTKPVIMAPQVAIGALGRIQVLPRFDAEGAVRAAHILHASWSADHRVLDGVTVARFNNALKLYLERPANLLLDL